MDTVDPRSHVSSDRSPIVVGLDGSPAAAEALRWAAWVSQMTSAPLSVVHVYAAQPPAKGAPDGARHAEEALARTHATRWLRDALSDSSALPYGLRLVVVGGDVPTVLAAVSATASMLVLGSGDPDTGSLRGVGDACRSQADCPVVSVKAPGVPTVDTASPTVVAQAGSTLLDEHRARS